MWLMSAAVCPRVLKHFNEVNNILTVSIVFQSLLCNTCNKIRNWTIHSQAVQLENNFKAMGIFSALTHFSTVSREIHIVSGNLHTSSDLILWQDNRYQSIKSFGMKLKYPFFHKKLVISFRFDLFANEKKWMNNNI